MIDSDFRAWQFSKDGKTKKNVKDEGGGGFLLLRVETFIIKAMYK